MLNCYSNGMESQNKPKLTVTDGGRTDERYEEKVAEWFDLISGYRANVFSAANKDKQAMAIKTDLEPKGDLRSVPSEPPGNNQ